MKMKASVAIKRKKLEFIYVSFKNDAIYEKIHNKIEWTNTSSLN